MGKNGSIYFKTRKNTSAYSPMTLIHMVLEILVRSTRREGCLGNPLLLGTERAVTPQELQHVSWSPGAQIHRWTHRTMSLKLVHPL